jgi:hypothetical protein
MACTALTLVLAMQFAAPSQTPLPEDSGLAPRRTRPVVAAPLPEYSQVLAAPVFAPDRKPSVGSDTAQAAEAGLTVLGLASGRGVGAAVMKAQNGPAQVVRMGDTISGWKIVGLDRNHVILDRNGKRLALGFDPDHPPSAVPANGNAASGDDDQENGQ